MQIKFYNLTTLTFEIVNLKGGTFDETLDAAVLAIPDLDLTTLEKNDNILKFNNYLADIIYIGIPKAEQRKGRTSKDWTDKIKIFNLNYTNQMTAKALSVKADLPVGQVYYIANMLNVELKKGKRGRRG